MPLKKGRKEGDKTINKTLLVESAFEELLGANDPPNEWCSPHLSITPEL